jgi:hypothetical protein
MFTTEDTEDTEFLNKKAYPEGAFRRLFACAGTLALACWNPHQLERPLYLRRGLKRISL